MACLRSILSRRITLVALVVFALLSVTPSFAADVTTPFAGKAVNGGTVTHEHRGGKHVLTVSTDFQVPGSPDPHWQVVDSKGTVYLLDRLKLKDDKINRSITLPAHISDVTIPDRVGAFDTAGSTVVFEIVVDDYAEVWVNGNLPIVLGQTGGPLIKGFNAPNRVLLGRNVRPGQQFQLAVFGMNGPVSNPPGNFIWVRSATLDFYQPGHAGRVQPVPTEVIRRDSTLDDIVSAAARIEKLADGFLFTEGPVWIPRTATTDGHLLFSDPNANTIYRWSPDGQVSVFRTKSGYTGVDVGEYGQPGSNGLTLDREGRLTINEHGNRRVTRLEKTGALTVLADRYEGKRLNSPNDLVYRSDGALYFTDPPFGLPKFFDDARKALPFSGVFCLINGELKLVSTDLSGPNGLAFSPDERYLSLLDGTEGQSLGHVLDGRSSSRRAARALLRRRFVWDAPRLAASTGPGPSPA